MNKMESVAFLYEIEATEKRLTKLEERIKQLEVIYLNLDKKEEEK